MAELKRKLIRYPNEREAYGIYGYTSEQSIKDTINDIDSFFVNDLKLKRSVDAGQLDLDNIPDLDIKSIYDKSTTARWTSWSYGYKMYEFTDVLQSEFPIILKLDFRVTDTSYTGTTSYRSRPYMGVRLTVMSASDGQGQPVTGFMNFSSDQFPGFGSSSNSSDFFEDNVTDSYGFYDNTGGRLYVCICPNMIRSTSSEHRKQPMINFYIERSTDYNNNPTAEYIMFQDYQRGYWDSGTIERRNNTYFRTKETLSYNSFAGSYIPMDGLSVRTSSRTNLFRTLSVHPRTNQITPNSNMLSYLNADIPISGVLTNVRLSETEVGTYITVSPSSNNVYVWSSSYGHLIRVD